MPAAMAAPYMDGDALAFVEDLDRAHGRSRLDLTSDEPVGDRVVVV
jgi:hypothetical protein